MSYNVVLYCIVSYLIALYCIVLCRIMLYCIALHFMVLHCIVLYYIVLYGIVFYCIVFLFNVSFYNSGYSLIQTNIKQLHKEQLCLYSWNKKMIP